MTIIHSEGEHDYKVEVDIGAGDGNKVEDVGVGVIGGGLNGNGVVLREGAGLMMNALEPWREMNLEMRCPELSS